MLRGAKPPISGQGRGPKLEPLRAESGGRVLEDGAASPPRQLRVRGSAVRKLPQRGPSRARTLKGFLAL